MTGALDRDACVTCGDAAMAGRVVAVRGATATVEADGRREQVGIELVAPVAIGDVLVCHAGIALQKAAPETADFIRGHPGPPPTSSVARKRLHE